MRWLWIAAFSFLLVGCQATSPLAITPVDWAWSYAAGDYIRSKPVIQDDVVYIGADDNHLHAVDVQTGEALWRYQTNDNVTAVAVDENGVYFGSWDGTIYALDPSGALRWEYQTDGWVSAAPMLHQDMLYVGSHDGSLYALSTEGGELLWQYKTNGRIEAHAALAGDLLLFSSTDGYVHALERERGQRQWYFHTGDKIVAPPVIAGGDIYLGSLNGIFYALDSDTGELRWSFRAKGAFASTPAVIGDTIFVGSDDGRLYALDTENGQLIWQQTIGQIVRSSLTVWEDLLFAGTDQGTLYAFAPSSGAQVWRYQLGGMISAGPTVAADMLFVGSTARRLQAFVLKEGQSNLTYGAASMDQDAGQVERAQSDVLGVGLAEQLPQIEEYTRLWAAQAAMPSIDAIHALHDVIAFRPQSPAAYEAHLTLARYYAHHSPLAAEEAYRAALAYDDNVVLHLELARYLESQGQVVDAYAEYKLLLGRRVDAFAGMRRTGSDPVTVAKDLIAASFYSDAVETLRGIDDPAALPLRGQALLWLGQYEEAVSAYQMAIEANPTDEAARYGLALSLAWLGDAEGALEEYRRVDTPESQQNQAQLLAADEPDEALALYLASPRPAAWWSATAILESQGRLTETLPIYARLATTETQYADDAAYRLYILGQRLDDEEAQEQGQRLLADFGLNWLALRSSGEELHLPTSAPVYLDNTLLAKVQVLEAIGYDDLAHMELAGAARFSSAPEVDLAMAQALVARGEVIEAQAIAEQYIRQHEVAPLEFWELSYPRPYSETVTLAASEYDLDPLLIWAIMREESRFEPDALSHANARGLMQVIPSTQDWIAGEVGATLAPGDAYIPRISIGMGAWLLRFLLDYFEGDLELAVLAYNGGAASVEYWQADPLVNNRDDLLRWIGYNETRLYLKRVALSYAVYRQLYAAQ